MSETAPNIPGGELERTRELKPGEIDEPIPEFILSETLPAGALAGQYVIKRLIGSGGGGMVYAAEHQVLRRAVAVKVLRRDKAALPSMVARFVREARAVNLIGHPNIVDIFEFGELEDGRPFYVMELLDGANLRKLLHLHGRFSPSEVLDIFEPVCAALEAAHKAGVVHRDLKASNISVLDDGKKRVIKLLDFGIAKLLHPEPNGAGITEAGSMLGTSHYMAPEQIRAEPVDARADVYALGVLLYQLLTGQYPFHSEQSEEIAWMHLTAPVPQPSQLAPVPRALDLVVRKAMEKNRSDRYPSAIALAEALRDACGLRSELEDKNRSVPACAIYVEVRPEEEGAEIDEPMLEEMALALDTAEQRLLEAGFVMALHTTNALLGIRTIAEGVDAGGEPAELVLARNLLEELELTRQGDQRLHVNIAVRPDRALFVTGEGGSTEVTGGPLLDIETWVPQTNIEGVEFTRVSRTTPPASR
jgi:serine/threonine protein kinase